MSDQDSNSPIGTPVLSHSPAVYLRERANVKRDPALELLHNNCVTKDTAFTAKERQKYSLLGLLPPAIETLEQQEQRVISQFRAFDEHLNRYIFLSQLKQRNETLFYRVLINHLDETLPIVYTPTVGLACQKFAFIWRGAEGLYLSHHYRGQIRSILNNWKNSPQVDIIVVTDGSRILGLGDLGINGMGIPIGKLSLYVAAAGFHPMRTLPICIDVGTNNKELLEHPFYLGDKQPRLADSDFFPFMKEFVDAVHDKWPHALIQFEDFSTPHCFDLLEQFRHNHLCFNDDIQGTGAVVAAGFLNAAKWSGISLGEHRLIFFGAGSAGIGVADSIVSAMVHLGIDKEKARKVFFFVDSKGLVTSSRETIEPHKKNYVRTDYEACTDLVELVRRVKPTGIIGLSGTGGTFTQEIVNEVAKYAEKPIIFALSNPTSKAECSAEQAFQWTDGRCVFASGSPFPPVEYKGNTFYPGQGNNMYIFPGLGFGAVLAKSKIVSDEMINAATTALASCVTPEQLEKRLIYPKTSEIRNISMIIAEAVIKQAVKEKVGSLPCPEDQLHDFIRNSMYNAEYLD